VVRCWSEDAECADFLAAANEQTKIRLALAEARDAVADARRRSAAAVFGSAQFDDAVREATAHAERLPALERRLRGLEPRLSPPRLARVTERLTVAAAAARPAPMVGPAPRGVPPGLLKMIADWLDENYPVDDGWGEVDAPAVAAEGLARVTGPAPAPAPPGPLVTVQNMPPPTRRPPAGAPANVHHQFVSAAEVAAREQASVAAQHASGRLSGPPPEPPPPPG
jgi:hypothetical protein